MGVYNLKQYLLINKSLGMTKGKMCSQAANASLAVFFNKMVYRPEVNPELADHSQNPLQHTYTCVMSEEEHQWKQGSFSKITLACNNDAEILSLCELAQNLGIASARINDNGVTQVEPGSLTAGAIGPFDVDRPEYEPLVTAIKTLKLL